MKKSAAGGLSEIKLIPDDLNVVSCLDENNNESSKILDRYLDVELIISSRIRRPFERSMV